MLLWRRVMISGPCRGYEERRSAADMQMQGIAHALETRRLKFGSVPIAGLEAVLADRPVDPWGHFYEYSSDGQRFRITSLGADGVRGGQGEGADIELDSTVDHPGLTQRLQAPRRRLV
jgi:hypothetical protein